MNRNKKTPLFEEFLQFVTQNNKFQKLIVK